MEISQEDLYSLYQTFQKVSVYDFSNYAYKSFLRRIEKVLTDNHLTIKELIKNLNKDYNYLQSIVNQITVNTTELFRDPDVWIAINKILFKKYFTKKHINIWHAGCSSGLEVYSMLILLDRLSMLDQVDIFGTDINEEMLDVAQSGRYRHVDMQDCLSNFNKVMNPEGTDENLRVNYSHFIHETSQRDYVQMSEHLTEKPLFLKHNLLSCQTFINKQFDIIMCRNVLIYFDHDLQNRIINFFYNNLVEGGLLIFGKQEGIYGNSVTGFEKVDNMYIKRESKRIQM